MQLTLTLSLNALLLACLSGSARGQLVAWTKGMYCKNGNSNTDTPNAQYPVVPLWNLSTSDWFLHGACRNFPPPDGEFLKLPANGAFTVEIAANRAMTTLSYNGLKTSDWPDGFTHPEGWSTSMTDAKYPPTSAGCLSAPNIHAQGEADAAGTAFAIAYKSDISTVKLADFTVFSVAPNTPYKRLASYDVPNLPACPAAGCLCAWAWIPNHCGQDSMYQNAYRCQVTGADPGAPAVGTPQPAAWCEDNEDNCVAGPKQMTIAFQAEGNNWVNPGGLQKDNQRPSPGYSMKMGFKPGAQTDIFVKEHPDSTSTAYMEDSTCAASVVVTSTAVATTTAYPECPLDDDFTMTHTITVTVTPTPTETGDSESTEAQQQRRRWHSETVRENSRRGHGHANAHHRGWGALHAASIF